MIWRSAPAAGCLIGDQTEMQKILIALAMLTLAGCSATGAGTGVVVSKHGKPAGKARVEFVTQGGATAQMTVSLAAGETFRGTAVSGSRQGMLGAGFGPRKGDIFLLAPGQEWTGEMLAALSSPAGATMECQLREKRIGLGLEGGAIGTCKISDGRQMQVEL